MVPRRDAAAATVAANLKVGADEVVSSSGMLAIMSSYAASQSSIAAASAGQAA